MSSALRELLAKFTVEVDTSALSAGVAKVDGFAKKLTGFLDTLAGKEGFGAKFQEISNDLKERAGEINHASKMLGISAGEFQKLQYQSGASAETLSATFRTLQRNIGKAGSGAGDASKDFDGLGESVGDVLMPSKGLQEAFKKLNVDLKDGEGRARTPIDIFGELAEKIGAVEDPSTRAALAMKLFGTQGVELLPYFRKSSEELKQAAKDFDELGGGISEKTIKAYKDLGIQGKRLTLVQTSLYSAVAEEVIPALVEKAKVVVKLWSWLYKLQQNTNAVKAAVLIFGAAIAWQGREALIAGAKTALAYAPVIIAIAALILLVDDLITTFQGGDSAISRAGKAWLEWLDGSKASAEVNQDVWDAFVKSVKDQSWSEIFSGSWDYWTHDLAKSLDSADIAIKAWLFGAKDSVEQFGESVKNGVQTGLDWLASLPAKAKALGLDFVKALIDGLGSGAGLLDAAIMGLGKAFLDKVRAAFQWHSPPKMALQLGEDWDSALVQGLAGGVPQIQGAAQDTFQAMLPTRPSLPVPASGGGAVRQSVQQSNRIDITVQGGPADRDTAASIRDAILPTLNDNAAATLAALEPTVDDG